MMAENGDKYAFTGNDLAIAQDAIQHMITRCDAQFVQSDYLKERSREFKALNKKIDLIFDDCAPDEGDGDELILIAT